MHRPKRSEDLFLPLVSLLLHHCSVQLTPVFSPGHIPDLHNTAFQPDTILLLHSFPFWSVPIYHLPALPDILRSEIQYQSTNLTLIIHISHCCCYSLIFLRLLLFILGVSALFICPYPGLFFIPDSKPILYFSI